MQNLLRHEDVIAHHINTRFVEEHMRELLTPGGDALNLVSTIPDETILAIMPARPYSPAMNLAKATSAAFFRVSKHPQGLEQPREART